MKRYFQNFTDLESVKKEFEDSCSDLQDEEVLFAWYGYGDYCGDAIVLYRRGTRLYEVASSHCSCNGIEGTWDPQEVSWEQLAMRNSIVDDGYEDSGNEAKLALAALIRTHCPRA